MSQRKTPSSKTRRSRLPQNSPNLNFSPDPPFQLTGLTPPPQNRDVRFQAAGFNYQTRLPQPNLNQNPFYVNRPYLPPGRPSINQNQAPSGSSYHPNMDFSQSSQHNQSFSPLHAVNLDMDYEHFMEFPPAQCFTSQQYPTQDASVGQGPYPTQDASMGQGSGHGSYHGSIRVEDDVEETSPVKSKKVTKRATKGKGKGKNVATAPVVPWTKTEEVALCRAWVHVSENSERGNSINRSGFWDEVIAYFESETGSTRSYDSITTKWKGRIRSRVGFFCAIMDNIKDNHGSGENDEDDYEKACNEYRVLHKHEFTLKECWKVLRGHSAWKTVEMPNFTKTSRKKSRTSETTSGSTKGPFNPQEVDDSEEEETRESRPKGRDAAKKKSHEPPASFLTNMAENFFKIKKSNKEKTKNMEAEYIKLKQQEMELAEARARRAEELKREKLELQRQQLAMAAQSTRTQDLIFYNTPLDPNMPARQLQELEQLKASIKERYTLDY